MLSRKLTPFEVGMFVILGIAGFLLACPVASAFATIMIEAAKCGCAR